MKNDEYELLLKLEKLLRDEEKSLCMMQAEVKKIHGGSLYIRKRGGYVSFAEYKDGKEQGVGREKERVYALARKQLLEKRIALSSTGCSALKEAAEAIRGVCEKWTAYDIEDKLELLRLKRMHPEKVYWGDKKYNWMSEPFQTNPYMPETLKYATMHGVRMRSKSERTIGNRLEERGILYRYEQKLTIDGAVCYPDFLIRKESGELVIWEHMGLMHRKDYFLDAMKKIERYRKAGFFQHRNLICTWEEDLENMGTVDEIIDRFIVN